jgi:hypothetical protein
MKGQSGKFSFVALLAAGALLLAPPAKAQNTVPGAPPASGDKGLRIEESDTMVTMLKRLEGRPVKIRLAAGGEELSGKIQKVTKDLVQLSDLTGREFFDAIIRVDQVASVAVQVRGR